jgi:hypothetical protein
MEIGRVVTCEALGLDTTGSELCRVILLWFSVLETSSRINRDGFLKPNEYVTTFDLHSHDKPLLSNAAGGKCLLHEFYIAGPLPACVCDACVSWYILLLISHVSTKTLHSL